MFFCKIGRDPPAFDAARLKHLGNTLHGAAGLKFLVGVACGVQPQIRDHIRLTIFGDGGNGGNRVGLHQRDLTAIALLKQELGDIGRHLGRGPVHLSDRHFTTLLGCPGIALGCKRHKAPDHCGGSRHRQLLHQNLLFFSVCRDASDTANQAVSNRETTYGQITSKEYCDERRTTSEVCLAHTRKNLKLTPWKQSVNTDQWRVQYLANWIFFIIKSKFSSTNETHHYKRKKFLTSIFIFFPFPPPVSI